MIFIPNPSQNLIFCNFDIFHIECAITVLYRVSSGILWGSSGGDCHLWPSSCIQASANALQSSELSKPASPRRRWRSSSFLSLARTGPLHISGCACQYAGWVGQCGDRYHATIIFLQWIMRAMDLNPIYYTTYTLIFDMCLCTLGNLRGKVFRTEKTWFFLVEKLKQFGQEGGYSASAATSKSPAVPEGPCFGKQDTSIYHLVHCRLQARCA